MEKNDNKHPKFKSPLIYIVILIILLLLVFLIFRSCDNTENETEQSSQISLSSDGSNINSDDSSDEVSDVNNPDIGSIITMGKYEQDNNVDNGPEDINWIVIAVDEDKTLLMSEYILDVLPYAESDSAQDQYVFDVTWENSSIRSWLNSSFFENSFTSDEQSIIQNTSISNEGKVNPFYGPFPAPVQENTQDNVFLLSVEDVLEYLTEDNIRRGKPTEFCESKGIRMEEYCEVRAESVSDDGRALWWLRTPGYQSEMQGDFAVFVSLIDSKYQEQEDNFDSFLLNSKNYSPVYAIMNYAGASVGSEDIGVRPCIWIK